MSREPLIRRLLVFARRHGWESAAVALFALALVTGIGPVLAGAGEFLDALKPEMAAEASDRPAQVSKARIDLPGFAPSRYAPQVLFPITSHLFPLWMELRGSIGLGAAEAPPPGSHGRPAIAICIDDLGEDLAGTDRAMALPKQVALSFLPYADATPFLAQEAKAKGHDVLAHVPMEAISGTDPGPMTLKVGSRDAARMLDWNMSRVPGLKGINNHEGSRFTEDEASLAPVMQALKQKQLFFFDSRTVPDSKGVASARSAGIMSAGRDVFLDDVVSEAAVRAALDGLAAEAKRDGVAIAIGHPHEVTLKVLAEWLSENHGVELISLPEAIKRKSESVAVAAK
jgi:polysaccharide deacetylase 2 family uncharacterized protein YibQ